MVKWILVIIITSVALFYAVYAILMVGRVRMAAVPQQIVEVANEMLMSDENIAEYLEERERLKNR